MKQQQIIITAVVALVVGAAAFFGGMQYQKMQRGNFGNGQFGQGRGQFRGGGQNNPGGPNGMGRPVAGQISSADDSSITVKMPDGSSKIVLLGSNTSINEATTAAKTDLQNGKNVLVFGTQNADGSYTASNIQINPQTAMFRTGGQNGNGQNPTQP